MTGAYHRCDCAIRIDRARSVACERTQPLPPGKVDGRLPRNVLLDLTFGRGDFRADARMPQRLAYARRPIATPQQA